ncbi:hypothetical protein [Spirosoma sp. KNUC1025]|uniref:hypothetical protein n=1 Tax=Spirosoma sp. KNUC1025 TaxID=2894082 RepID=UPI003869552F|nr:glycosyltransferase family 39 protein [Spirosoma sp. KNUC1025]
MWKSFNDKINNTPPLYFVLGWWWAQLFTASELSLRLFSSIGLALSSLIIWRTLRRTYSFWGTSLAVIIPFCGSPLVYYQNSEARMYGLYLIVTALGLVLYDNINKKEKPGYDLLIANVLVHAAFIQTHLHGVFFSGAILVSFMARDWYFKQYRPMVYLSIVVGWLSFLLYLPTFLVQADAGNPRTWIYLPTLRDLVDTLTLFEYSSRQWLIPFPFAYKTWGKLAAFVTATGLSVWFFTATLKKVTRSSWKSPAKYLKEESSVSLLILAYAFLAVPVFVWCISYIIKPVFMDRYLMPVILSWTIMLAQLFSQFIELSKKWEHSNAQRQWQTWLPTLRTTGLIVLAAGFLAIPVVRGKFRWQEGRPGSNDNKFGYESLPIVINYSNEFLKLLQYSPQRDRYRFVQHWPSAVDTTSGLFPPQEYKHLEALKRRLPHHFKNQIIQSNEFLKTTKRFLVFNKTDYAKTATTKPTIENAQRPQWFNKVIKNNPNYKVTKLGSLNSYWYVHLVEAK